MSSKMRWLWVTMPFLLAALQMPAQVANWPLNDMAFTSPAAELGALGRQPVSEVALPSPSEAHTVSEAQLRQAIAQHQAQLAAHPQSTVDRVALVYLLVDAGAGEQARTLAQKAALSGGAAAHAAEGWAFEHDLIGVRMGGGFRWKDAIAAWRKVVEATPNNASARLQLAVLEEHDARGFRYSSGAHLEDAIAQYRKLNASNHSLAVQYQDNLFFDLLYTRHYAELLSELKSAPASPVHSALAIAAATAGKNVSAGVTAAKSLSGDARTGAIRTAAASLISMRLYTQAVDLITAAGDALPPKQMDLLRSLPGRSAYAESMRKAAMPLLNSTELPPGVTGNDPRTVVQDLMVAELSGRLEEEPLVEMLIAHHTYPTVEVRHRIVRRNLDAAQTLLMAWKKTGAGFDLLSDMALSNVKLSSTGEDATGYRVMLESVNGSTAQSFFVIHRQGYFHVVGNGRNDQEAGSEAMWMLQHASEPTARAILDWKREQVRRNGNSAFAMFWTVGEGAGTDAPRRETLAAAALLTNSTVLTPLLPTIAGLRDKSPATEHPAIDVLLARGYIFAGDAGNAVSLTRRLLTANPDSATIQSLVVQADGISREVGHWNGLLEAQMAKRPGDRALLEQAAKKDETAGDFVHARSDLKAILDGGHAATVDYNLYGWLALFNVPIAEDAMPASLHANEMSNQENFSALHTLACLQAVTGHTAEARKTILHGMEVNNLATPNDAVWMVMGYVYEQYGLKESAVLAYRNVPKPERPVDPSESYVLAQRRLKVLGE